MSFKNSKMEIYFHLVNENGVPYCFACSVNNVRGLYTKSANFAITATEEKVTCTACKEEIR